MLAATSLASFMAPSFDERDFPRLPPTTDKVKPPLHSRVSSFQSLHSLPGRVATPKIPPGFELSHAHPSPTSSRPQTPSGSGQPLPTKVVIPVVPTVPVAQRVTTPRSKATENTAATRIHAKADEMNEQKPRESERVQGSAEVEAPANEPDVSLVSTEAEEPEPKATVVTDTATPDQESYPAPHATVGVETDNAVQPKIIPLSKTSQPVEMPPTRPLIYSIETKQKQESPDVGPPVVATLQSTSSRPSTPATTTSESSKTSVKRPMTIRVTTNVAPKAAESVPASAVTERSMTLPASIQAKNLTQADSVASPSPSRPSTPAMSDRFSADISRASSPPPSLVGTAPERTKTKAQQKKERKEKAKKATEASEPDTPATPPVVEEVAPVVGRQRKQKKIKGPPTKAKVTTTKKPKISEAVVQPKVKRENSDGAGSAEIERVKPKPEPKMQSKKARTPSSSPTKKTTVEDKPAETPQIPFTVRDLFEEASRRLKDDPTALESTIIQHLLDEHIPPITRLLNDLFRTGELDRTSSLFHPTPLNSSTFRLPPDTRNLKGANYLAANGYTESNPFGTMYLGNKEKHALLRGQDVSVSDETHPEDLLRRALVTGWGTVYRHLSAEEEEKVVNLEEKREEWHAEMGDRFGIGLMNRLEKLETSDYNNIEGDVGDLVRVGERYGIGWVKNAVGRWEEDEEDEDDDEEDLEEDEDDEYGEEMDLNAGPAAADDDTDDLGVGDSDPNWNANQSAAAGPHGATAAVTPTAELVRRAATTTTSAKPSEPSSSTTGAYASHLRPIKQSDLRTMPADQLDARIKDATREMDLARKEIEKIEKLLKGKDREVRRFWERVGGGAGAGGR